jgi:hypothetical protein
MVMPRSATGHNKSNYQKQDNFVHCILLYLLAMLLKLSELHFMQLACAQNWRG